MFTYVYTETQKLHFRNFTNVLSSTKIRGFGFSFIFITVGKPRRSKMHKQTLVQPATKRSSMPKTHTDFAHAPEACDLQ